MTNLNRLILEMGNRLYYTEENYSSFLEENGLVPTELFNHTTDMASLLKTVIAILESLSNNIDYFRRIETEFSNTSEAYTSLRQRIQDVQNRLYTIPSYEPTETNISFLYHN